MLKPSCRLSGIKKRPSYAVEQGEWIAARAKRNDGERGEGVEPVKTFLCIFGY